VARWVTCGFLEQDCAVSFVEVVEAAEMHDQIIGEGIWRVGG
jgi:hypothetical protein